MAAPRLEQVLANGKLLLREKVAELEMLDSWMQLLGLYDAARHCNQASIVLKQRLQDGEQKLAAYQESLRNYEATVAQVTTEPVSTDGCCSHILPVVAPDALDKFTLGELGVLRLVLGAKPAVVTWNDVVVTEDVFLDGDNIAFTYNGRTFRGCRCQEEVIFRCERLT